MKRYIKAAYDSSMPDWLRLKSDGNKYALEFLNANYAMSQAKFYTEPQPDSIPIHLLYEIYKEEHRYRDPHYKTKMNEYVYVPDGYRNSEIFIENNGKFRSLATSAKSKIASHIVDTVYMVAPKRQDIRSERNYVDPRYEKGWGEGKWRYQGQYPEHAEGYVGGRWTELPEIEGWYTRNHRDKSGYAIPNPEELYARLYERFPDRNNAKVEKAKKVLDEYYDKLDTIKNRIFSMYDIRKGHGISIGQSYYNNVLYRFNEAISDYGRMYRRFESCIDENGNVNAQRLAQFLNGDGYDDMPNLIRGINAEIGKINNQLQ